jgi:hypothetical protein
MSLNISLANELLGNQCPHLKMDPHRLRSFIQCLGVDEGRRVDQKGRILKFYHRQGALMSTFLLFMP